MRKSILLFIFLVGPALAACDDAEPTPYAIIDAVPDRATALHCEPFTLPDSPAPTEIRLASDSTWTLLDGSRRQILELDDGLRIVSRTPIPDQGPGAAEHPVSVAAVGDSAWAVAARGGLRLVVLSRGGEELSTVPLDFIPHSLEALAEDEYLVSAMPFGTKPPTALVRVLGSALLPVPVPRRTYEDMTVNALGNTTLVEAFPDGSALVVNQFLAPRGYRVDRRGDATPVTVPTPAGTREAIDFVPRSPLTDEQMPRTLVPAMAMSVDVGRSEVYLLTRSGRERGGRPERALLRLTDTLEFLDAFLLDVPAAGMVYLPRTGTAVVHDDADRFYSCRLADPDA